MSKPSNLLRRIGPGLITASVVLGPGSIVSASRAGAETGYSLLWVVLCSGLLMAAYTSMGARLGCALGETTPLARVPRWFAVLVGLSSFLVCTGFQFGNNLGVAMAMNRLIGLPLWLWPLLFTAASLVFLFTAKRLYTVLERMMMLLVGTMIAAFAANLFWTGVDPAQAARGFIPSLAPGSSLIAKAMIATTFSIVAALYQAYLVRAKQWTRDDLRTAIGDAWIGIAMLGTISAVILIGAAQSLHGTGKDFNNIGALADVLRSALGGTATMVFCCGLAAASFSSFIVNAMAGATLFADGLGLESRMDGLPVKVLTAAAMTIGCGVAVATTALDIGGTTSVLIAQAGTLLAVPFAAGLLLVMTSSPAVMGDLRNGRLSRIVGLVGFLLVLGLALMTASSLARTFCAPLTPEMLWAQTKPFLADPRAAAHFLGF